MPYDWANAHFLISCVGMSDGSIWSFTADRKWFIRHGTPGAALVPFLLDESRPATLEEVVFLADCISYDHDMPTVVRPSASTPAADVLLVEPIVAYPESRPGLWYYAALEQALGMATEIRVGEAVELRYSEDDDAMARFESRFADVLEPLTLYAMATRQVDILTEYLCLYRVLEWPNRDNGKPFIADHLDSVRTHDFGDLYALVTFGDPVNVFGVYQDRAAKRIDRLTRSGLDAGGIAEHLYGIRNALAHGRSKTVVNDFSEGMISVADELPLIKFLARLVIEARLR